MEFYLVVYELKGSLETKMISFDNEKKAINCASQIASAGMFSTNEDEPYITNAILKKVIKFNAYSLRGVNCELTLNDGRFELKENKPTKKNS